MPRKKVSPSARRRVAQACQHCKASKRKCNASLPCNHCVKRGLADTCDAPQRESVALPPPSTIASTSENNLNQRRHDGRSSRHSVTSDDLDAGIRSMGAVSTAAPVFGSADSHDHQHESSPETTRANMLSNNAGEYVFVGRSASLSFLQLMRETVARCIGPSEFSEHTSRHRMLEVPPDSQTTSGGEIVLDPLLKKHCIEYFFLATAGLIGVVSPQEAREMFDDMSDSTSYTTAIRLLIIAIGSQAGSIANVNVIDIEKRAFSEARAMMFTSMLENPSLDMIRAFLLLSFYMLGACHRNAAFLYLGIAARAAHALGLHTTESYAVLDEDKRHVQLRCWKSLVSLEMMVSSILGRSTAILAQRSGTNTVVKLTEYSHSQSNSELEAVYRLALLVDLISSQFNGPEPVTAKAAQTHLQSLKDWSDMLPARLRPSTVPLDWTHEARQSLLGCMQVSCFYYFVVMLVTRPFLIVHVTRQLFPKRDHLYQTTVGNRDDAEELALACLNAAAYMAQTCFDLLGLNMLVQNMCLLKAWIFTAGLVLGFEMFANNDSGQSTKQAFISCRRVLRHLAAKSPQALQYNEILTLLSTAIERHWQIQISRKDQNTGSLVARIMDLHSINGLPAPSAPNHIFNNAAATQNDRANVTQLPLLDDGLENDTDLFHSGTGSFIVLDDLPLPSPESFMFDLQSFGMMPWDVP